MKVLIIGGLSDEKFYSKTRPIVNNLNIKKVYLFRAFGNIYAQNPKVSIAPYAQFLNNSAKGFNRVLYDLWNNLYFLILLFLGKIDVIIGIYLYPYGYYASILAKLSRKPFVLVLPGSDLKILTETKKHLSLFKSANYFAVRGTDSKTRLNLMGISASKIFILHNVVEMTSFNHNIPKVFDLIFVGYLRPLKRLDRLVKIVFELKKTKPNILCAIVGDGPEKGKIEKMVIELKLYKNIIFLEHSNNIPSILAKSKVLILTSDSEGLPMAIIEAMMAGLPVVSSSINDIPDIVQHGKNGFLVKPNETKDFISACHSLLDDEALRVHMGSNARSLMQRMFKSDFSEDAQQELWIKYLLASINYRK